MYVKLFATMLDSSIWDEDHATVRLWITLLAMADEAGIVYASTGGIAHRARVTHQECVKALRKFQEPDLESKNQDYAGRRIELLDGGWQLLNDTHYREMQTKQQVQAAVRQRRHREKQRDTSPPSRNSHEGHGAVTPVTTEAEAEAEAKRSSTSIVTKSNALERAREVSGRQKDLGRALDNAAEFCHRYFVAAWSKTGRYILSNGRRKRIIHLIKEGFQASKGTGAKDSVALSEAVSEICYAVDGSKKDRNIAEHQQFQTIDTILRDRGTVEKYRDLIKNPQRIHPTVQEEIEHG